MIDNEKMENLDGCVAESLALAQPESCEQELAITSDEQTEEMGSEQPIEQEEQEIIEPEISRGRKIFNSIFSVALIVATVIMAIVVVLNTFVFFKIRVSGPSMQPTLYTGNRLIANKYGKVVRGSIIIIKDEKPNSDDWLIKRVIGVGGDVVEFENGYVKVNGELLDEPYLKDQGVTNHTENRIEVPEGEIFYLGDNRIESADSRTFGTCTTEQVVGVVENWSILFKNWFNK